MILLLLWSPAWLPAKAPVFQHILIDGTAERPVKPYIKLAGDLDNDRRADIVVASAKGSGAYWYSGPDWGRHIIRNSGTFSEQGALCDLDGDGDTDIILPGKTGINWYENRLDQPEAAQWPAHFIGSDGANVHDLVVSDLDNDGEPEIAVRYEKELRLPLTIFKKQPDESWGESFVINHYGEGLAAGDVDGDGWTDLVVNELCLHNDGGEATWTPYRYVSGLPDQLKVICGDLDRDGRAEIVVSPQSVVPAGRVGKIACYFLKGQAPDFIWEECVLEEGAAEVNKVHGLTLGDLDGDGDLDLITSKRHDARGAVNIAVFWNMDGTGRAWEKQIIANQGSHNHVLADINGDRRLDIVGANWNDEAVVEAWVQDCVVAP